MFSTSDMQALIEKIEGGQQGVDLVKIGQNFAQQGLPCKKIDNLRLIRGYVNYFSSIAKLTSDARCPRH